MPLNIVGCTSFAFVALKSKAAHKAIINFPLGANVNLQPDVTGYIFLRTDFTYTNKTLYRDAVGYMAIITWWNNYHCQVGANMKRKRFYIKTGLLVT